MRQRPQQMCGRSHTTCQQGVTPVIEPMLVRIVESVLSHVLSLEGWCSNSLLRPHGWYLAHLPYLADMAMSSKVSVGTPTHKYFLLNISLSL